MGIDPGTRLVGWAVLEQSATGMKTLNYDAIKAKGSDLPQRLKTIYIELNKVIKRYRPTVISLENVFYAKDVQATVKIGEGRAIALLASAQCRIPVYEYTPAEIKKSVTGNGRADKAQVAWMVKNILGMEELKAGDASDALAIALCHVHRS